MFALVVYLALVYRQEIHTLCKGAAILEKNVLFTKPGNAGHGVTFDMSCMQIIQYRIFMSWV